MIKTCSTCSEEYEACSRNGKRQKYCSHACRMVYYRKNGKGKDTNLLWRYGISLDEYNLMMVNQSDRCANCLTDDKGKNKDFWNVDHNHETGKIRALLCSACNKSLGLMGEDAENIRALADYLDKHEGATI